MNRSPAFQFYPDKWQSHTRRLSDSAYRVYHELLCWMWQHSPDHCSVDASEEACAFVLVMNVEIVRSALAEIQNKFSPLLKVEEGRFVSDGLRKEFDKQHNYRISRSLNGKLGGRPRKPYDNHMVKIEKAKKSSLSPSPSPTPLVQGTPIVPNSNNGGDGLFSVEESEKPFKPDPIQTRLGNLFGRKPTTKWTKDEVKSYRKIVPVDEQDLRNLENWYSERLPDGIPDYRRRNLITLLNNFSGELDKARNYKPQTCI